MSKVSYIRKPSRLITITCEWDHAGEHHTYDYKYTGDEIDAIISCYKNVVWSNEESFEITSITADTDDGA